MEEKLLYFYKMSQARKWRVDRVGNCPPRFWQNRRRTALCSTCPPRSRKLLTLLCQIELNKQLIFRSIVSSKYHLPLGNQIVLLLTVFRVQIFHPITRMVSSAKKLWKTIFENCPVHLYIDAFRPLFVQSDNIINFKKNNNNCWLFIVHLESDVRYIHSLHFAG